MGDAVDRFSRVARVDRSRLPDLLDDCSEDEVGRLADLLESALQARHDEVSTSIDDGLGMVPRPLRRPVKKVLGV